MSAAESAPDRSNRRATRRATVKALPRRDRYAFESRRLWVSSGIMLLAIAVLAIVVNVVFSRVNDDLPTYFIAVYMVSWVTFVICYTLLTVWAFGRRDRPELQRIVQASRPKRRRWPIMSWMSDGGGAVSWTVQVSVLSVAIIVILFTNVQYRGSVLLTVSGGAVVASCWVMMVISFAVQYAREDVDRRGLEFPGDEPAVFDDYLYHAVTVSSSLAVSDTTATTSRMRRLVRSHTLIAFAFNTVIVALLVSLLTIAVD